jgi:hypothetical protein
VQDYATRPVAAEQPYIHRLTRLGVEAAEARRGLPFIAEVLRESSGTARSRTGTRARTSLTRPPRAGLDLAELDRRRQPRRAPRSTPRSRGTRRITSRRGHWGVPTMVFQGEPFFGQDRVDLLVWRLQQHGLVRR